MFRKERNKKRQEGEREIKLKKKKKNDKKTKKNKNDEWNIRMKEEWVRNKKEVLNGKRIIKAMNGIKERTKNR